VFYKKGKIGEQEKFVTMSVIKFLKGLNYRVLYSRYGVDLLALKDVDNTHTKIALIECKGLLDGNEGDSAIGQCLRYASHPSGRVAKVIHLAYLNDEPGMSRVKRNNYKFIQEWLMKRIKQFHLPIRLLPVSLRGAVALIRPVTVPREDIYDDSWILGYEEVGEDG